VSLQNPAATLGEGTGPRRFLILPRTLSAIGLAVTMLCFPRAGVAQCPDCTDLGTWGGPFGLDPRISAVQGEIAHAALIPTGSYAGRILLWRAVPGLIESWIYVPENPGQLIKVQQVLPGARITCSGASWDRKGRLVVAGGLLASAGTAETFRFDPFKLQAPTFTPTGPVAAGTPWTQLADMSIKRYYPTLFTLTKLELTSNCGGLPFVVAGGSTVLLSGPPHVNQFEGNEYWQFLPPGGQSWSATLRPDPAFWNSANQSQLAPLAVLRNYDRMPLSNPAEPRLDSYAKGKQLGERLPTESLVRGRIFIAGDVDSWEDLSPPYDTPNKPGKSWVFRPPWPQDNTCWELWHGPDAPGGGSVSSVPNDHYYDPVVVLHTRAIKNRVLRFGGSRRPVAGESDPCAGTTECQNPQTDVTWWPVDNDVEEFVPDYSGSDPIGGGDWVSKAPMCSPRVFHTATVLPTGQIFIEGGTSVDEHHQPCRQCYPCDAYGNPLPSNHGATNRPCGVTIPEIYDPGTLPSLPGSSCKAAMPNIPAGFSYPTPRGYHHLAVLLADGSVWIGGGHADGPNYPDSEFLGEIYYPPCLTFGTQPSITTYPTEIAFDGSPFVVKAIVFHSGIDRVVLTRPAAITHHFDNDQIYIELDFNAPSYSPETNGQTVSVTVTPPHHSLGPPGWYLLWVVEEFAPAIPPNIPAKLIPSTAKFVFIE